MSLDIFIESKYHIIVIINPKLTSRFMGWENKFKWDRRVTRATGVVGFGAGLYGGYRYHEWQPNDLIQGDNLPAIVDDMGIGAIAGGLVGWAIIGSFLGNFVYHRIVDAEIAAERRARGS
jgi:hypothetical protein